MSFQGCREVFRFMSKGLRRKAAAMACVMCCCRIRNPVDHDGVACEQFLLFRKYYPHTYHAGDVRGHLSFGRVVSESFGEPFAKFVRINITQWRENEPLGTKGGTNHFGRGDLFALYKAATFALNTVL